MPEVIIQAIYEKQKKGYKLKVVIKKLEVIHEIDNYDFLKLRTEGHIFSEI